MASRKSNKNRRAGRRKRRSTVLILLLSGALLALAASVFIIFSHNRLSISPTPTTTNPGTTVWPYGQPEYQIEVPEGYEDLLPEKDSNVVVVPSPGDKEMPKREPAAQPAVRAEPYIVTMQKAFKDSPKKPKPTLIIVIDDVGYNIQQLEPFLQLPFPLTIAVLPQVEHTAESAAMASDAGKEVILHQPMQALGGNNPGPGAIYLDMSAQDIESTVTKNLEQLPQAKGINNHMGSAVTRDEKTMRTVLDLAKNRGIYYLDSLTAPNTATAGLCWELSVPYWERDVFLDNTGDRQSILHALDEGKKIASSRGASVLIGHVWSSELAQTLMDIYPQLVEQGYSLSTISRFMMMQSSTEGEDARPGD